MGNCARIKPRAYKACIGDMTSYISIYKKTKQATNTTAIDPNLNLTLVASMWAMQKSVNGEELFDGVNTIGKVTDKFYIRYGSIVLSKNHILEFDGNRYDIVDIIPNYEGRRELIQIKCSIRGDSSLINTRI
jgi:SPP1 family predicted phage head-tail adaptor